MIILVNGGGRGWGRAKIDDLSKEPITMALSGF